MNETLCAWYDESGRGPDAEPGEIRFRIEEAIYWFALQWHGGQDSNLYEALCSSPYRPGASQRDPSDTELYEVLLDAYVTSSLPE
jgi:hypothetical protein